MRYTYLLETWFIATNCKKTNFVFCKFQLCYKKNHCAFLKYSSACGFFWATLFQFFFCINCDKMLISYPSCNVISPLRLYRTFIIIRTLINNTLLTFLRRFLIWRNKTHEIYRTFMRIRTLVNNTLLTFIGNPEAKLYHPI